MTIKKLMMAAGAIDEPQVIAPSSNDWDYTFSQNEWPCAGNTLGDGTVGGFTTVSGGDSGISSLPTFDGAFDIEFDLTAGNNTCFGVHAIDEDDTRAISSRGDMHSMTNSFYWREAPTATAYIGSSSEGTVTIADGSAIKLSRDDSGTITLTDDGSVVKTFSSTYTGTVRFWIGAEGTSTPNFDNIFFTDTEKVQRDGMLNESTSGSDSTGDKYAGNAHAGFRFRATRTGTVTGGTVKLLAVGSGTAYNSTFGIYTDNGGNPGSLIGSVSGQVTTTAGNNVFTLTGASYVTKGTLYWAVFSDADLDGQGYASIGKLSSGQQDFISGVSDTITSIADTASNPFPFEIKIEATGEPTPDHDTLLLVHCNGTNGNTSFTDSSPFGRTITTVDGAHHDSGQAKFGSTSLYCDGTNDSITIPDSIDWTFPNSGHFTVDFWVYFNGTPANNTHICGQGTDNRASYSFIFRCEPSGNFFGGTSNGSTGSSITCSTNLSDAWHHVALVYNGILKLYIDGSSEGTPITHTNAILNVAYPFEFGGGNNSASHINAWFDEIRISRVARWDANFTPPSEPYP